MSHRRQWFTPAEVAETLGVSRNAVSKWLHSGKLPATRTGKRAWHITQAAVAELAEQRLARQASSFLASLPDYPLRPNPDATDPQPKE